MWNRGEQLAPLPGITAATGRFAKHQQLVGRGSRRSAGRGQLLPRRSLVCSDAQLRQPARAMEGRSGVQITGLLPSALARAAAAGILCPGKTGAFAEAYLLTRQPELAELVFAMNDWIVGLQYQDAQAAQDGWIGGFRQLRRRARIAHHARCGDWAATPRAWWTLIASPKLAGDERRMTVYRQAAESAFKFLMASPVLVEYVSALRALVRQEIGWRLLRQRGRWHGPASITRSMQSMACFHYLSHVAEYDRAARSEQPASSELTLT